MSPKTHCPIAGDFELFKPVSFTFRSKFLLDLETRNDKETGICLISIRLFRAPFFHKIAVIQLLL